MPPLPRPTRCSPAITWASWRTTPAPPPPLCTTRRAGWPPIPPTHRRSEGRAKAEAALGQTDAAIADYTCLVERVPQPSYLVAFGELLEALGRTDEAAAQYGLWLRPWRPLAVPVLPVEPPHAVATTASVATNSSKGRRITDMAPPVRALVNGSLPPSPDGCLHPASGPERVEVAGQETREPGQTATHSCWRLPIVLLTT